MRNFYSLSEWMQLTLIEKLKVKIMIGGKKKGLKALARESFFNTGGNPLGISGDFKNLMIAIY